jgi:hypothetical protein
MNAHETMEPLAGRCATEACPRQAESGEAHCADCGLERSLYYRERRDERGDRERRDERGDREVLAQDRR